MSAQKSTHTVVFCALLLAVVALTACTNRTPKPATDIDLPAVTGDSHVRLADSRGKPTVVNFFASWCTPCRKEMPALQQVSDRLSGKVAFMGVDHQDNRDSAAELLKDTGVKYPTGYDPDGKVAKAYGLFGMPTTLFVSADGRVLETHTGELSRSALEDAISKHFSIDTPLTG